jgi:hypothetical protein
VRITQGRSRSRSVGYGTGHLRVEMGEEADATGA